MPHLLRKIVLLLLATGAVVVFVGCDTPTDLVDAVEETPAAATWPDEVPDETVPVQHTADPSEPEPLAPTDDDEGDVEDSEAVPSQPTEVEPMDGEPSEEEEVVIEVIAGTEPAPAMSYEGSEPTNWSPTGTMPIPSYGYMCRYVTDTVLQTPSNGYYDDTLFLDSLGSDDADVTIEVREGTHTWLTAMVDLTRGLKGKSWRDAIGIAQWHVPGSEAVEANVVDGTLCFAAKLKPGQDVLAEFSLILDVDGEYVATGGNVLIPGDTVSGLVDLAIDADLSLDVDLR